MHNKSPTSSASTVPPADYIPSFPPSLNNESTPSPSISPPLIISSSPPNPSNQQSSKETAQGTQVSSTGATKSPPIHLRLRVKPPVVNPSNQGGRNVPTEIFQTESSQEDVPLKILSSPPPPVKKRSSDPSKRNVPLSKIASSPAPVRKRNKPPNKRNVASVVTPVIQGGSGSAPETFQRESKQQPQPLGSPAPPVKNTRKPPTKRNVAGSKIASSPVPSVKKRGRSPTKRNVVPSKNAASSSVPTAQRKKDPKKRKTVQLKTMASIATKSPSVPKAPTRETPAPKTSRGLKSMKPLTSEAAAQIPVQQGTQSITVRKNISTSAATSALDGTQTPARSNSRRGNPNGRSNSEERLTKKQQGIIAKQRLEICSLKWALGSLESTHSRDQFPNLMKSNEPNKIASILYMCNEVSKWCERYGKQAISISADEITSVLEVRLDVEHKMTSIFDFIIGAASKGEEMPDKESFCAVMNALLSIISVVSDSSDQVRMFEMTKKFVNQVFDLCFTAKVHILWATNFVEHLVGPLMTLAKKECAKFYDILGRCCIRTILNAAKKVSKGKNTSSHKPKNIMGLRTLEVACSAACVLDVKLARDLPMEKLRLLASKDMMFALHMDSLLESA